MQWVDINCLLFLLVAPALLLARLAGCVQAERGPGDHGRGAQDEGNDCGNSDWHARVAQAQQQSLDHSDGCPACVTQILAKVKSDMEMVYLSLWEELYVFSTCDTSHRSHGMDFISGSSC